MTDKQQEYMDRALMAEWVPMHLFADIAVPMKPDNERIPGRDDLEESND